jgi:hypothetical protein
MGLEASCGFVEARGFHLFESNLDLDCGQNHYTIPPKFNFSGIGHTTLGHLLL